MRHNIYGASILLVFEPLTSEIRIQIIDIRTMVDREVPVENHRLDPSQLPIQHDSEVRTPRFGSAGAHHRLNRQADGLLTALQNLEHFLRNFHEVRSSPDAVMSKKAMAGHTSVSSIYRSYSQAEISFPQPVNLGLSG